MDFDAFRRECSEVALSAWRITIDNVTAAHGAPKTLFHFTDCGGLIGILKERCLRASLASALNDTSEVAYGIEMAKRIAGARSAGGEGRGFDRIERFLTANDDDDAYGSRIMRCVDSNAPACSR